MQQLISSYFKSNSNDSSSEPLQLDPLPVANESQIELLHPIIDKVHVVMCNYSKSYYHHDIFDKINHTVTKFDHLTFSNKKHMKGLSILIMKIVLLPYLFFSKYEELSQFLDKVIHSINIISLFETEILRMDRTHQKYLRKMNKKLMILSSLNRKIQLDPSKNIYDEIIRLNISRINLNIKIEHLIDKKTERYNSIDEIYLCLMNDNLFDNDIYKIWINRIRNSMNDSYRCA